MHVAAVLLLGLLPSAQAKKIKVGKLIDEVGDLATNERYDKCLEKVELGLGEERATDEQRVELAFIGYQCAVRSGDTAKADELRPDDAKPGDLVAHAYLYMNEGRFDEAETLVADITAEELQQDVVEIQAQTAALQGRIDEALAIVAEQTLREGPRAVVAEAALMQRRPAEALSLLEGTCEALTGPGKMSCERLAPVAQAVLDLEAIPQPEGAPEVPATAVHRIDYALKGGAYAGGNAFLVAHGDGGIAITPLHLFGPPMGLPEQLASADLPDALERVLFPHDALLEPWEASEPIVLPNAEATGQMAPSDVAMFRIPSATALMDALVLAEEDTTEDAAVWIMAPGQHTPDPGRRLHPGTVRSIAGDGLLEVRIHDAVELGGLSGAPVLDEAGQVVGMAIGGGMAGPSQVALAIPVSALSGHLDSIDP